MDKTRKKRKLNKSSHKEIPCKKQTLIKKEQKINYDEIDEEKLLESIIGIKDFDTSKVNKNIFYFRINHM